MRWPNPDFDPKVTDRKDPRFGKTKTRTLTPNEWGERVKIAAKLCRELDLDRPKEHRAEREAPRAEMLLTDAVDRYFKDHQNALRPRTLRAYRDPADLFLSWAAGSDLRTVQQLQRGKLKGFAAHVLKRQSARGGALSQRTVKKTLRAVSIVLNWLFEAEISRLGRDDVRLGLKMPGKLPKPGKRTFLSPEQIAELLKTAREHDAATFKATRKEHAANTPGATARYAPVEPVIRFLLLSGLRLGELLSLRVGDVHLTAEAEHGYFDVRPSDTKTKEGRQVKFDVAPSLATMLEPRVRDRAAGDRVFNEHTHGSLAASLRRLHSKAPTFSYQLCRVTTATYLACMPSVGPVNEAEQLGHSPTVAITFYIKRVRIAPEVKTLEAAMGL